MACDLEPQCNFLYVYFTCKLLEDPIDVEVTLHTLNRIHTIRKDHNTKASMCSPWGTQVRPSHPYRKKMKEYIEERQKILNLFVPNREFPNRPVLSPFI